MSDGPSVEDRIRALRGVPLFAGLEEESLRRILDTCTEFDVPAGHVLIEAGHPGTGLFIIEEGEAEVQVHGQRITLGPGEFVGELALLTPSEVHGGRVSAKTPLHAVAISRNDLQALLLAEPKVVLAMLETLAMRLASTNA
jgi:CRP-like cAMP-binding protein